MKSSPLPDPVLKRKRIPIGSAQWPEVAKPEIPNQTRQHYADQKVASLEKKVNDLVAQKEAYHILVQKHYSEKVRLRNRIGGVMKHIRETLSNDTIPGGKIKKLQNPDPEALAQENRLLRWKLSVIEKFFENSFPDVDMDEKDADISSSGTPLKENGEG